MTKRFELSSIDMMTFLIQSMVGIRILALPREIARCAETDSWISVLVGGVFVLIIALMLYWLGIKYPGKNGSQIAEKVFGKLLGKMALVIIAIHTIGSMGLGARAFGNSIKLFLLSETPLMVIAAIMVLLALYALVKGLKTISTLVNILLPQLLFFIVFILILPFRKVDIQNILPVFSNGIKPILRGSLEVVDALYGFTIIAYIMPYFKERESTKKWIFAGVGIAIAIYLGIIMICLLVFGGKEVTRLLYPTLSLAKSIQLKSQIIERAESFFMIAWVIATFVMLTLSYFVSYENLKVLFGSTKGRLMIYIQLPLIWFVTMLPRNTAQLQVYTHYLNLVGRVIMLMIVPVLVIVTLFKERRKKNET
ncbi:MAG: endospore germination permease [Clostridia bacterium]